MSNSTQKLWHESASLLIITPNKSKTEHQSHDYDFNVLMTKRSAQTSFVPNHAVFPGGKLDVEADESVRWLQYFESCGVTQTALRQLLVLGNERPHILAPQGTGCYDRFFKRSRIWAREISLRLTALRETFEEVGVLICLKCEQLGDLSLNLPTLPTYCVEDFDKAYWQERVHNDPQAFLLLCQSLNVVPNLWALHEWSAWSTPAIYPKRFDVVFFITFLPQQPTLLAEPSEVQECLWQTPSRLLDLYCTGELFLPPPQIYELSRLLGVHTNAALRQFAHGRSDKGVTLYLPVNYACTDNVVIVLPGDDFYVPNPREITTPLLFDGTVAQFRARAKRLHRVEDFGSIARIFLNFEPLNGHLPPQQFDMPKHKL